MTGTDKVVETGIEETATSHANASKGAAAAASVDTGFDTTPVTATVSPALAPAPETVETGFGDLGGTPAPPQQATSAVDPREDRVAIERFMGRVVPWPGDDNAPGYVNLHYDFVPVPGKKTYKMVPGWAFKTLTRFREMAEYAKTQPPYRNLWQCMSLQKDNNGQTKSGYNYKAKRNKDNALAVKSLWIDLDLDANDPKKYPDQTTALKAVIAFCKKHNLPDPSAIVHSGNGLHMYWISQTVLTVDEWRLYAEGFKTLLLKDGVKIDPTVTADVARLMRLPTTQNRKDLANPKPVVLLTKNILEYDFSTQPFQDLKQYAAAPAPKAPAKPLSDVFDVAAFKGAKPSPIFGKLNPDDKLSAGCERLLDHKPIFDQCPMYDEALKTGGAGYDQGLWMMQILGTTFMEGGNDLAHAISKKHSAYASDDTDAMFGRKMAERDANRTLGYPSCAAFKGAGCATCEGCPLLGKIKSPLNITPAVSAAENWTTEDLSKPELSFVDPYAEFVGPEFPLEILPPTIANFVNAEHCAMGADPAAIAMAALTAVAGAMDAETQVRVGDGWWEKPILWTSLVGQPSSMKSPIIKKATQPLSRIDHERDKCWRDEHARWAQINNKTIPSPPKAARCLLNDATPEKVAEVLSRDPSGALMVHDELAGWLGSFERYNNGQSSRAFYLTSWNGGPFLQDRIGKGKNDANAEVRVQNLALGVLGGIQPDRLTKLGDLTSDGLLQRFLAVLMKPAKLGDPEHPVAVAEAEYEKLIKSINTLPARNYRFAHDALDVRDSVLDYIHKLEQVDGFPASLIGAIGKLKGYFARICLVLHVAQQHDPLAPPPEPVHPSFSEATAERLRKIFAAQSDSLSAGIAFSPAISREIAEAAKNLIMEFLLTHMIGLYDVVVNGGQERDKLRLIANFILASDKDRLRPSDFTAGVRALRGEPEQKIREWAGRFCGMDWLLPEDGKPGIPTRAWRVTSGLRDHFAERRRQAKAAKAEMHAILKAGGSRRK